MISKKLTKISRNFMKIFCVSLGVGSVVALGNNPTLFRKDSFSTGIVPLPT